MAEFLKININNPERRKISRVVERLNQGGIIIYPTDTVYAIGCAMMQTRAVEAIYRIRNIKPKNHDLTMVCRDFSQISQFTRPLDSRTFKVLKRALPGPYTFVLRASAQVPNFLRNNRKTIGVRIPNNPITIAIVDALNTPLVSTSLKDTDEVVQYTTTPEEIYENFKNLVDIVIDAGTGGNVPSTVVDFTSSEPFIIREGLGEIFW